jgi:hypothetical protein
MNSFAVASDERLIELIKAAKRRLVAISPAVSDAVAAALNKRIADEGKLNVTVILDADPEVYRLGFGTASALRLLQDGAVANMFDLRVQPAVRIGILISDDITMVYSPVPLLIEAGSALSEKPNAIMFHGGATDQLPGRAAHDLSRHSPIEDIR